MVEYEEITAILPLNLVKCLVIYFYYLFSFQFTNFYLVNFFLRVMNHLVAIETLGLERVDRNEILRHALRLLPCVHQKLGILL